jgi:small subunit ribosomal protein S20
MASHYTPNTGRQKAPFALLRRSFKPLLFSVWAYILLRMPITTSAKKALRASLRKRKFNEWRKNAVKRVSKNIKKLLIDKKLDEAQKTLSQAYKAIDKAAKRGILKKNTAARRKSRIARLVKKSSA